MIDVRIVDSEVKGRVQKSPKGLFASQVGHVGNAALPLVAAPPPVAPLIVFQASPLKTHPQSSLSLDASSVEQVLPSALAAPPGAAGALPPAHPDDDLPALPPLPRPPAALRAELAEIEDGRDPDDFPPVVDPPPVVLGEVGPDNVPEVDVVPEDAAADVPEHLVLSLITI